MTERRLAAPRITWWSVLILVMVLALVAIGLISGLLRQKGFRGIVLGSVDLCSIPGAVVVIDGIVITQDDMNLMAQSFQENARAEGKSLTATEASQEVIDSFVVQQAVGEELHRRGLNVSPLESPEGRATFTHELLAKGVPTERVDDAISIEYLNTVKDNIVFHQMRLELPEPSESDISAYLAQHDIGSFLLLNTMSFSDTQAAAAVMSDLATIKGTIPKDEFREEFSSRTKQQEHEAPPDDSVPSFQFHDPQELPDFAQDAFTKNTDDIGLYRRNDGTVVIYYVLENMPSTGATFRDQAITALRDQAFETRKAAMTEELRSKADVKICQK